MLHRLRIGSWFKSDDDWLFYALDANDYDQADLVLCLLRINTPTALHHVAALVGKPITYCKPVYHWKAVPAQGKTE